MQTYHIFFRACEQRKLLWMSMTISRNLACVNRLKDLLNELLTDATKLYVPASRGYWRRNLAKGGGAFSTPTKRYRVSWALLVDDFDRKVIRWKIYHLYQTKEHVTPSKLLVVFKEDNHFHGQRSTFNMLLREMGFKWVTITFLIMPINIVLHRRKRVDGRCHYYEQPRIIEQRHT